MDHLQNTNFCNVLSIRLAIRTLWIWVQESNLHQFTKTFVHLELIFEKIHQFQNVKTTFLKNICGELHWKAEMVLSWILFVKFWVSEHDPRLKKWQLVSQFSMGHFSELLEIQSWNFLEFHFLFMQPPGPGFIKIQEGYLGKHFKIGHFYMEWP